MQRIKNTEAAIAQLQRVSSQLLTRVTLSNETAKRTKTAAISSLPLLPSAVCQPASSHTVCLPVSKLPRAARDGVKGLEVLPLQQGGENDSYSAFIISNVST